jgi:hypothetical protein
MAVLPGGNEVAFNGTTPVTLLAAPAASTRRVVPRNGLKVHNRDTAQVTVTLRKLKGASTFVLKIIDLDPNDDWFYDGVVVLDATDESITALLGGAAATTNPDADVAYLEHT